MNYRHAFHAGNFADVFKHITLVRILVHLRAKPAAFRVIDTHAGAGRYELDQSKTAGSQEWRQGIARFLAAEPSQRVATLLAPYCELVTRFNPSGGVKIYPGSPLLVREFLREQDRLIACELDSKAAAALACNLQRDHCCKPIVIDGWTAVNAFVPPKERRGVVVIDPPFEKASDFERLANAVIAAQRKWASGIYVLWYPLKDRRAAGALAQRLRHSQIPKILRAEITLGQARNHPGRLNACGLIIVNPPWTLEGELRLILPELVQALAQDGRGGQRLDWLAGESR
jgi:23S rRNA (adenine2030-N6)-methyltransferase